MLCVSEAQVPESHLGAALMKQQPDNQRLKGTLMAFQDYLLTLKFEVQ